MEDIEKLKKLQVNLAGRAAMEALKGCRSRISTSQVKEQWMSLKTTEAGG
jgi:hypothetical protein